MFQALQQAAQATQQQLTMLTPAVLRQALKSAGKVVHLTEVAGVLSFVISDEQYNLEGLYLLHMQDDSVEVFAQLSDDTSTSNMEQFFRFSDKTSEGVCNLFPDSCAHQVVVDCPAWRKIAR